jgi:subtilisin family serine protease
MSTVPSRLRIAIIATIGIAAVAGTGAAFATNVSTDRTSAAQAGSFVRGHVLVKFPDGTPLADQAALEHANSASVISRIADLGVEVLQVPVGAEQNVIDAMRQSGRVDYAELDAVAHAEMTPNDTYFSQQWGLSKINAPTAWDTTTGAASTVVAVLDTGVDYSQPDLQGRLTSGYDFINNDSDPTDDNGHGTETAGIVGAASNNAVGVAGVCWTCTLMPVKVLNSSASGSWSAIASGITWATDHGAKVISMSLAGSSDSSTLHNAVSYAYNHDVVVVAASGNYSTSTPYYPAAYPEVLSVAGTTSTDSLYSWSNYGSWVKVAAPGCVYTTVRGGSYGSFCGTSAATPVVAGLAALVRSAQPGATAAAVETAIESSAVPVGSTVAYGRIDAAAAVTAIGAGGSTDPSTTPSPSASPTPTSTTVTSTFSGTLNGKSTSRSYSVAAGAGAFSASLTFSKAASMTVDLRDANGQTISTATGGSPVHVTANVAAGSYAIVVSGPSHLTFTVTVSYTSP